MITQPTVDAMIEALLNESAKHALDTDDELAYQAGCEYGGRWVLRRLAGLIIEASDPYLPEMSE